MPYDGETSQVTRRNIYFIVESRCTESVKIRGKYPDRIPVRYQAKTFSKMTLQSLFSKRNFAILAGPVEPEVEAFISARFSTDILHS